MSSVSGPHDLDARCTGELVLKTRGDATSFPVNDASGSIELAATGNRVRTATISVPMPEQLRHTPSSPPTLEWQVVEVRDDSFDNEAPVGRAGSNARQTITTSTSVIAAVEFNRVRTRAVHRLDFEYTDLGLAPNRVHLSRLGLDASAHRLVFPGDTQAINPAARAGNPMLKRAELTLHCGLFSKDRSEE